MGAFVGASDSTVQIGSVSLDYEVREEHTITVEVVDCDGLAGSCKSAWARNVVDSAKITINVITVNEASAFPRDHFSS